MWIWEQTAIISLYSISWVVFITDTLFAYCAVRTGSLNLCDHFLQRHSPWRFPTAQPIADATVGCCQLLQLKRKCKHQPCHDRPVWTGEENLAPSGTRSLDHPARSQSLYRLSYPSPPTVLDTLRNPLFRDVRRKSRFWSQISWKATLSTSFVPSAKVNDFLSLDDITYGSWHKIVSWHSSTFTEAFSVQILI